MQEAVRTYLELALGLTDASRKRVRKVVKEAVGRGGATTEQAKMLTGDLLALNSANRKALAKLVRFEVDRALGVVGLATAEEVNELTTRVRDLERQLRLAKTRAAPGPATANPAATANTVATTASAAAKRAMAKRATLPEAGPATRRPATTKTAAPKTVAPETVAPETAAPETAAPKTAAPKTAAPKTAARKAQP